jgi:hypothetical protein
MAFPDDHLRLGFIGSRRLIPVVTPQLLPFRACTSQALSSLNAVPSGLRLKSGSLQAVGGSVG